MKKFLKVFLVVLICASFSLSLASCAKNENEESKLVVENIAFEKEDGILENEEIKVSLTDTSEAGKPYIKEMIKSHLLSDDAPIVAYEISSYIKGSEFYSPITVNAVLDAPLEGVSKYNVYHIMSDGTIETIEADFKNGKVSLEMNLGATSYFVFAEAKGYAFEFTTDLFLDVLPIIGQCLLGVFGSIAFIILVIFLLNKGADALSDRKNKSDD